VPEACTLEPGAWPMIRMREVALNRTMGRGPAARLAAQRVQAAISACSAATASGEA